MRSEDAQRSPADQGQPSPSNSEASTPTIQLPKGGGAIRGIGEKFAANPVTGTGSMSVPIATSPGRSGFGPQLPLSTTKAKDSTPALRHWDDAVTLFALSNLCIARGQLGGAGDECARLVPRAPPPTSVGVRSHLAKRADLRIALACPLNTHACRFASRCADLPQKKTGGTHAATNTTTSHGWSRLARRRSTGCDSAAAARWRAPSLGSGTRAWLSVAWFLPVSSRAPPLRAHVYQSRHSESQTGTVAVDDFVCPLRRILERPPACPHG